jgi:UDP-glucuronate 4-epimerase
MRILVTGGAGFIGSHVCEALLARGEELVVLDDFDDFYDPALKRRNAALLKQARIVEGDIRDRALLKKLFAEGRFEAVIHLAARAGVRPSLSDPLLYEDVNVRGTLALLRARAAGDALRVRLVLLRLRRQRQAAPTETDDIHQPVSPYAATARRRASHYHHLYGLPVTCLRFFTVYAAPAPRWRSTIRARGSAARPIPFFGDGSTRRDYTYVGDIVDGAARSTAAPATRSTPGTATISPPSWSRRSKGCGRKARLGASRCSPATCSSPTPTWARPRAARASPWRRSWRASWPGAAPRTAARFDDG